MPFEEYKRFKIICLWDFICALFAFKKGRKCHVAGANAVAIS